MEQRSGYRVRVMDLLQIVLVSDAVKRANVTVRAKSYIPSHHCHGDRSSDVSCSVSSSFSLWTLVLELTSEQYIRGR